MRIRAFHIFTALALVMVVSPAAEAGGVHGAAAPSGRALLLEAVRFSGNEQVPERILRGALTAGPGDTVTVERIEEERLRVLHSHHLVRDVRAAARPGSGRGLVVLEMEIEERSRLSLETGFGYHDIHGWFLTVGGVRFRPAGERDAAWRAGVRIGFHLAGLDADWEKPGLLHTGAGVGARGYIYNQEHIFFGAGAEGGQGGLRWDGPAERELRQNISRAGAELYLLYRHEGEANFSFGLRAEAVEPDSTFKDSGSGARHPAGDLPAPLLEAAGKSVITGFQFRMIRDTRDLPAWPRAGSFTHLSIQSNSTLLGGDEIYTRIELDTRIHAGLGGGGALAARLRAGAVSSGTPYYDRFFLGGIHSLRGYRELSLSPPAGHDGFWLAGCEVRVPLIEARSGPPRLSGLLFFDAGQGWLREESPGAAGIEAALGYGFRLRLPWFGTLGLDFGLPLGDATTGDLFRVHGALGFSY